MTVIYIDSVFVLNTVTDYLLCLLTARLAGIPLRRWRYLLAALAGGCYAVSVFLPGAAWAAAVPVRLAAGVLMALIAYGGETRLLRLTLLLFALSCALAGCVLAMGMLAGSAVPMARGVFYTDVSSRTLLVSISAASLLGTVLFRGAARHRMRNEILPVRLAIGDRVVAMSALWDSGNGLREPATGKAVLVTTPDALGAVLPAAVQRLLTPEALRSPAALLEPLLEAAPRLRPRLLPYHAVGTDAGLLLVLRTDWIEVCGVRYEDAPAALSPTPLGAGYAALWGGDGKEGRHGKQARAMAPEDIGTDPAYPLHWRQRHPAAAADTGAGGGAGGAAGRGGRPEGAHRA